VLDRLIDLIFANLPFVVIIIGGLFSFLKRMGDQQRQQPSTSSPPDPMRREEESTYIDLEEKNKIEEKQKRERVLLNGAYDQKKFVQDRSKNELIKSAEIDSGDKVRIERKSKRKQSRKVNSYKINQKRVKKKVVEGVIWGEITGPPRSRNPHSIITKYRISKKAE
jgi:hypothetical protein